ncbi:MAG: hypothetical protein P9M08_02000 [Candidatus Erginobacter occultus]|nr:hypothetical protein [Candidatus Erginobacter occultus]
MKTKITSPLKCPRSIPRPLPSPGRLDFYRNLHQKDPRELCRKPAP